MDARQKALLDLYYRVATGKIPVTDLVGTLDAGQLPSSVFADIGTSRLVDGSVTQAKLGADVTMIKSIQRFNIEVPHLNTYSKTITEVNMDKAFVIVSSSWSTSILAELLNSTTVKLYNNASADITASVQVIEFL